MQKNAWKWCYSEMTFIVIVHTYKTIIEVFVFMISGRPRRLVFQNPLFPSSDAWEPGRKLGPPTTKKRMRTGASEVQDVEDVPESPDCENHRWIQKYHRSWEKEILVFWWVFKFLNFKTQSLSLKKVPNSNSIFACLQIFLKDWNQ